MLFNSLHFCIFFPIVAILYFIMPERYSWMLLLVASCYFYMSWQAYYMVLIALSTVINYFAARIIIAYPPYAKLSLWFSIISSLGILFVFKYLNFFCSALNSLLCIGPIAARAPLFDILLPVGISFYTFQTMSYTIDVYRGTQPVERHFGKFGLFVTFFPQLVAGPIERAGNLLDQFQKKHTFNYVNAVIGLRTFLGGMLLKVVVADNLSKYVDAVYNNVHDYTGWPLIFATYLFAFQIFADFAGYTYMAIGIAQFLNFKLMENFKQPYLASSISEFWKRWHISLSTWFRDYVYIPLGGSRVSTYRWYLNTMITFLISGLWHGANWTFVLWGALNGFYIIIATFIPTRIIQHIPHAIRILVTFYLTCFAWIFFRANSLADASYIVHHLFSGIFTGENILSLRRAVVSGRSLDINYLFVLTAGVWMSHLAQAYAGHIRYRLGMMPRYARLALYYASALIIFLYGEFGGQQFIYFQF